MSAPRLFKVLCNWTSTLTSSVNQSENKKGLLYHEKSFIYRIFSSNRTASVCGDDCVMWWSCTSSCIVWCRLDKTTMSDDIHPTSNQFQTICQLVRLCIRPSSSHRLLHPLQRNHYWKSTLPLVLIAPPNNSDTTALTIQESFNIALSRIESLVRYTRINEASNKQLPTFTTNKIFKKNPRSVTNNSLALHKNQASQEATAQRNRYTYQYPNKPRHPVNLISATESVGQEV